MPRVIARTTQKPSAWVMLVLLLCPTAILTPWYAHARGDASPLGVIIGPHHLSVVTTENPSLDPAFVGNARPFTSPTYDRYRELGSDANDLFDTTYKGAKVYPIPKVYAANTYKVPTNKSSPSSFATKRANVAMASPDVGIPGTATYTPVDNNSDGIYDALFAVVDIDIVTPGDYLVRGTLKKNGVVVANQPAFEVSVSTQTVIEANQAGQFTATLPFSGEEIYQSGEDGPYNLEVLAFAAGGAPAFETLTTPTYDHTHFGERSSRILSASDAPSDTDSDGRYDDLVVDVEVNVLAAGAYLLQGTLRKNSSTIARASDTVMVGTGTQMLRLRFPGVSIFRSGEDGPFEAVIALFEANGERQDNIEFLTQSYDHTQFEGILDLTGAFTNQGDDTSDRTANKCTSTIWYRETTPHRLGNSSRVQVRVSRPA